MLKKKLTFPLDDIPSYPGPNRWCASCCHNLSSEVYVSCTICKNVDLCLSCYANGININTHFKEHPVFVIIPSSQPGFEAGWTLREELVFIEALSSEYSFKWEIIANVIRTKGSEECRRHFFRVYATAIKAPDPRGGSSINYPNSKGFIFLNPTENPTSESKGISESKQISYSPKKTRSSNNCTPINSPKIKTESLSNHLSAQEKSKEDPKPSSSIIQTWSMFADKCEIEKEKSNISLETEKINRDRVINGDMYGYSIIREEFELGEEDLPEYATLNIDFDENDTEEVFYQKLEILQAYDSTVKNEEQCDKALSKLNSFKDLMKKTYKKPKGQQSNIYLKVPITEFSQIEPENFGLINYAEDPNEIEEVSKIIFETKSFFNQSHLNQNDGGVPSGTPLQAALFDHLLHKQILSIGMDEKDKETKETEDYLEENSETSIDKEDNSETGNFDEHQKENTTKTKKTNNKKKKASKSNSKSRTNLSESELNEWNENAPLAEKAHLYDKFYLKFISQQEINFIEEKRINATFYQKVKNSILPFIIGNFDREYISQRLIELYPNFLVEANLIVDYLLNSKLYNYKEAPH